MFIDLHYHISRMETSKVLTGKYHLLDMNVGLSGTFPSPGCCTLSPVPSPHSENNVPSPHGDKVQHIGTS